MVSFEEEQDYEAPQEASVLYKLYSLLDVLLMVRSTVAISQPGREKKNFVVHCFTCFNQCTHLYQTHFWVV